MPACLSVYFSAIASFLPFFLSDRLSVDIVHLSLFMSVRLAACLPACLSVYFSAIASFFFLTVYL